MNRLYLKQLKYLNQSKAVLISGPRQAGKTSTAQAYLNTRKGRYLNWDIPEDRETILHEVFSEKIKLFSSDTLVLDEIHKYHRWKSQLKGLLDRKLNLKIVVTGSARLDLFKKGGDSLLGRYEQLRLHPLTIGEILSPNLKPPPVSWGSLEPKEDWSQAQKTLKKLIHNSGFPEPYLSEDPLFYTRWSARRRDLLIKQDLLELENVKTLSALEELAILLPTRVGSPLSLNSMANELKTSFESIKKWTQIFESLFFVFRISAFSKKISRSILKEKKLYLWDYAGIKNEGARFENLVASHLLKSIDLWNDLGYGNYSLNYFRTKEKEEIDFIVCESEHPIAAIEVKKSDTSVSKSFFKLRQFYPKIDCIQLVDTPDVDHRTAADIRVVSAAKYLACLN